MAGDEFKAGRVRKLLKSMMPSSDAELVEKARAERKERAGGFESYQPAPAGRDDSIPTLENLNPSAAPSAGDDDGLLMDAPKKPKKKSKNKPGIDTPTDVNGKY